MSFVTSKYDKGFLIDMNTIFYKSSQNMCEVSDCSVDLIITSPPYFNVKDYSKDGYQSLRHSAVAGGGGDLGSLTDYKTYIKELLKVWRECERVLKPNGKLCINVPLMPMFKRDLNTHYNRQFLTYKATYNTAF